MLLCAQGDQKQIKDTLGESNYDILNKVLVSECVIKEQKRKTSTDKWAKNINGICKENEYSIKVWSKQTML